MLKKSIPILSVIAAVVLLLITTNALTNLNTEDGIQELKQIVINYIECANSVSAQAAYDKLLADFGDSDLVVPAVYQIGEKFREKAQYKSAILAHKFIVDNFPESEQAVWAQRGLAASYIGLGDMESAQIQTQKLIDNYISDPNIAQGVFEVADTYCWFGKNDRARPLYQKVIDTWPTAQHSMWSQMGIAISYIADGNNIAAWDATDNLILNYPEDKNLAEALFYIGGRFEWARKYDNALKVFGYIVENFPDSIWSDSAAFDIAKSNIYRFVERGNEPNALSAIDKFINTYRDKPELAAVVYDFAARADWINGFEPNVLTESVFDKFIDNFPQSPQIAGARISLARMGILSLIDANDDPNAFAEIDGFIADYNDFSGSTEEVFRISQKYYNKAMVLKYKKADADAAAGFFYDAIDVKSRIIKDLPQTTATANTLFGMGVIYSQELGESEKGIEYFEALLERYPEHENNDYTHYLLCRNYKQLKREGKIEAAQADEKIENNLKAIIENYPHSRWSAKADFELGVIKLNEGKTSEAVLLLENALQKSLKPDSRISTAKTVILLGDVLESIGQKDYALQIYKESIGFIEQGDPQRAVIEAKIEQLEGGEDK